MCPVPLCGQTILEQPEVVREALRTVLDGCGVIHPDDPNMTYVRVLMPRATWERLEQARRTP